jgi:hypothetical protein
VVYSARTEAGRFGIAWSLWAFDRNEGKGNR